MNNQHSSKVIHGKIEIDSYADSIVACSNCVIMNYTGRECNVAPYSDECETKNNVPIITTATSWQSPCTSQIFILILKMFYGWVPPYHTH